MLNAQSLGVDVIRLAVRGGDGDDILTGSPVTMCSCGRPETTTML